MLYLFTVIYDDGTAYYQNAADVSIQDPARSCFYDVDLARVARFSIQGPEHRYAVDLADGHFEVDGAPFRFHEGALSGFRLIFFRRHTHHFIAGREVGHSLVYRLGWQATDADGRNVQRVMEVD